MRLRFNMERCNHPAYHEDCKNCMHQFRLMNATEIKRDGFEQVLKKFKDAGYFE